MAMNGDALGAMIKTSLAPISNVSNDTEFTNFCNKLGEAIVNYITASATVNGTVTSGNGAGGSVTGTIQ